jgi:RNA polymerase sigma-70 factor (ECF subfamily)
MNSESPSQHLSHISTLWSLVHQAHGSDGSTGNAQAALLGRYAGAVHRYLLGALRDQDAADDLFQEFCLRFLRGDFRNADPEKGRFRNLVKTSLFHLIVDHQRKGKARPQPLTTEVADRADEGPMAEADAAFLDSWREELIDRAWLRLAELESATGQPCHTVLRVRTDNPLMPSAELAQTLSSRLRKPFTVDGVRQALHRAREKFTDFLVDEVAQSLEGPSAAELEEELLALNLHSYCKLALRRRSK